MSELNGERVAAYDSGTAPTQDLIDMLPLAWSAILADPVRREQVADALGVSAEAVITLSNPPVQIEQRRAFIDIGSVAVEVVTWVTTDILLAAFADMAKDEVRRRCKQVWEIVEPELRGLFDRRDALGLRSRDDDMDGG
jgi:hypothetical protein